MTFNRNKQLLILDKLYKSVDNEVVVFYSSGDSDINDIMMEFLKGKDFFYYKASPVSENEQVRLFVNSINKQLSKTTISEPDYSQALHLMIQEKCEKRVVVINEFQHIIKYSDELINEILKCVSNKWGNQPVLFILMSENAYFVENQMINLLKETAYDFSGLVKLPELSFMDIVMYFDKYSVEEMIIAYAILGGKCKRLESFDSGKSLKDNIIGNILDKESFLFNRGMNILPKELREHSVYNTILLCIAAGNSKLNDLHKITGFSRAKISVYINNLMEHNLIKKMDSVDSEGRDNSLKGLYSICDGYLRFFYRFIYPNLSLIDTMDSSVFYKKYISPYLVEFGNEAFRQVCYEYISILNRMEKLPIKVVNFGEWFGKVGNIDIVGTDNMGHGIICSCEFVKDSMSLEDFEWLKFCVKQAKLPENYYYLFSKNKFDDRLKALAKENSNIHLIDSSLL